MDSISRIEYFAAHAPEKIPDWFQVGHSLPPLPLPPSDIKKELTEYASDVYVLDDFPSRFEYNGLLYQMAVDYVAAYKKKVEERGEVLRRNEIQRYFEWRVYYGQQMDLRLAPRPLS